MLPTNEVVVIISGLEYDKNEGGRTQKDPVIFRQPLASMTTGGPVLQEGAGRLLAEVFPDLAGYFNDLGKHAAMGVVCFRDDQDQDRKEPPQCLLFMQHGHEDGRDGASVVTFDLSSPGNSTGKACVRKAEYWPRTAVPIVPLSVDRPNQYLSYQSVAHAIYDRSVPFSGSLASTQVTAALPKAKACPDSDEANVTQGWTTVASYLCDYHGQDKFQLKEETCDRLAFNKPFSTGFVVTGGEGGGEEGRDDLVKGIFLLPLFGSFPLLVLPLEVADHPANPALLGKACPLTWVGRADFWNKWNSFKPDNCGIEPSTTTGPPNTTTTATATGKSTTTTPNNVTASVDSTTGNSMLYIIIGVFVLVVILVLILITVICIWSKRGKSGQEKGGKGAKEDKSVSRVTSSAVSSKVPSKVASKVSSKVGGKAAPSKMTAKESASKQQPLKAVPSKSVAGGKAPSTLKVGSKVAPGSTFQTSAVA